MADEVLDAALGVELRALALPALVGDRDPQAAGQERRLAQSLLERRVVEIERLEDLGVREEGDRGAVLLGGLPLDDLALRRAADVLLAPDVAVAADLRLDRFRERVDDRDPDAVQAAGDLVALPLAELAARVQDGHDDLERGLLLLGHLRDGDTPAVVGHGDRVVGVDRDVDTAAEAGKRLVDRVVDHLVDEVVQPPDPGGSDVHAGALADGFEAFQDGDVLGVVTGRAALPVALGIVLAQGSSEGLKKPRLSYLSGTGPGRWI